MRLIDADALKEDLTKWFPQFTLEGIEPKTLFAQIMRDIDNAPTVNLSLNLDNVTEADIEKFKVIWQRANSKGLLVNNNERPQDRWGKWVISEIRCPNCLEYFDTGCYSKGELNKCPSCGAKLKGGAES